MPLTPAEDDLLFADFQFYLNLEENWRIVQKMCKAMGIEDPEDELLQSFYDDVLTDDGRRAWSKWSSGGTATATAEEWMAINARYEDSTPNDGVIISEQGDPLLTD